MKCTILSLFAFAVLIGTQPIASASTISWVDFSTYPVGAQSHTGISSSDGLTLDVTFSNTTNTSADSPSNFVGSLNDPLWPFDNSDLSALRIQAPAPFDAILRFDFTSSGGLPIGRSLSIIDFEHASSTATFTGFLNGSAVPVNWAYSFYQITGVNVAPPIWNSSTNTLVGSGEQAGTTNNFAFLTSDVQLDAVEIRIQTDGEAFHFGATRSTVPAAVPIPPTFSLFGVGLIAIVARRFT